MNLNDFKKLFIGGVELKQLFINGVQVWKTGYKNWVKYSTESDGVTIYNAPDGYKDGYRIRSGGAETTQTGGRITGYIPVVAGDVVRLYGWNFGYASAANAVNFSDAGFGNLGQFTMQPSGYGICLSNIPEVAVANEVYQFTVPNNANIRYMRITAQQAYSTLPPDMIVTVNEEIS